MTAKKKVTKKVKEVEGWYKGYDIRWLESEPTHPHFHLVEEYKSLKGNK